jgi:hypothetical protein
MIFFHPVVYSMKKSTSFPQIIANMLMCINWKVAAFLFIMGLFLFSDLFIDSILRQVPGSVDGITPSSKGTLIQMSLLVLSYIFVDSMIKINVL